MDFATSKGPFALFIDTKSRQFNATDMEGLTTSTANMNLRQDCKQALHLGKMAQGIKSTDHESLASALAMGNYLYVYLSPEMQTCR